jgi:hypothetical protein
MGDKRHFVQADTKSESLSWRTLLWPRTATLPPGYHLPPSGSNLLVAQTCPAVKFAVAFSPPSAGGFFVFNLT